MTWVRDLVIFTYIILVLALSVGCKTIDEVPITHFYVVDTDHQKCSIREITDKKSLASRRVATAPLEQCDGVWGISADEFAKLRVYLKGQD